MKPNVLEQFKDWRAFLKSLGYEYMRQEEDGDSFRAYFIQTAGDLKLVLHLGGWQDRICANHRRAFDAGYVVLQMPLPEDKNEFAVAEELAFGGGINGHICNRCPWFRIAGADLLRCEKGMKNPYGILGTGGRGWKVGERVRFLPNCERIELMKKHFNNQK